MTMVNGVGAWVGSILSGMAVDYFSVDGVKDWHTIWLMFAGYALFLAVIFFFGFKYNHDPEKDNASFSYTLKGFAALFLGAAFMIKVN